MAAARPPYNLKVALQFRTAPGEFVQVTVIAATKKKQMSVNECIPSGRIGPNGMDSRLAKRVSSPAQPTWLAKTIRSPFMNNEVGPGLLAQIAKNTGMRPEAL